MSKQQNDPKSKPEHGHQEEKLASPVIPLLWILIPLAAALLYGALSGG
jgi:hypothetical protein